MAAGDTSGWTDGRWAGLVRLVGDATADPEVKDCDRDVESVSGIGRPNEVGRSGEPGPPCGNTGVGSQKRQTFEPINPPAEGGPLAVFGWDWTQTTHDALGSDLTTRELARQLVWALGGPEASVVEDGKGLQGWAESVQVFDPEGYALGRVCFGGDRTDVHVVSTSAAADVARPRVTGLYGARTARVDTRVDTLVPFEELAAMLEEAAAGYGSRITRMESSVKGESTGRTIYLGSPKSAIRVRVYEKWLESPGQYVQGTNRVEVQLRPASKAKGLVSSWAPIETFCASRVTRSLADRLADELVPTRTLQVSRGTPDLERTLEAMGEQYGGAVERWLQHSGGDLGRVLGHLGLPEVSI